MPVHPDPLLWDGRKRKEKACRTTAGEYLIEQQQEEGPGLNNEDGDSQLKIIFWFSPALCGMSLPLPTPHAHMHS